MLIQKQNSLIPCYTITLEFENNHYVMNLTENIVLELL